MQKLIMIKEDVETADSRCPPPPLQNRHMLSEEGAARGGGGGLMFQIE